MDEEKFDNIANSQSELSPALASNHSDDIGINVDAASMDLMSTPRSSLPAALSSMDVAKQSREMVDEYIEQLGTNPEQTVELVQEDCSTPTGFTTSVNAVKNGRKTMEDRHIIIRDLNKNTGLESDKQYSYYAVFDGHAGIEAASYATAHLHYNLVSSKAFIDGRIHEAFSEAFDVTDKNFVKRCREEGIDKLKPSGTTALCALIEDNKKVYLAWVGDSQAVLVRNGQNEEIMLPHKPDMESERVRIQELGGLVVFVDTWRVNGILSVSRAIGDPDHKPYVIAEPSFSEFEIDPSLDFLVLGCDGLFDNLTGQDISNGVYEFLCLNEHRDPEEVTAEVSGYLSKLAINEGSGDNITTIVIFFKQLRDLIASGLDESGYTAESVQKVESASATTLPTTNGGHFPYTDFSELPLGANFNLHSIQEGALALDGENESAVQNLTENNLTKMSENSSGANDTPTDSADLPVTDVFTPDAAAWSQVEDEQQLPQQVVPPSTSEPATSEHEETPVLQSESSECTATSAHDDHLKEPLVAMDEIDYNKLVQESVSVEHVSDLADQMANFSFSNETATVASSIPASPKNPFELTNDNFATSLNNETVTSAVLSNNEDVNVTDEFQKPQLQEVEVQNETIPDTIQHPSDSGYCYTNSISEFSISFPSENKIEENFCSTPNQDDLVENVSESGLIIDNQSPFSQLADSHTVQNEQASNVENVDTQHELDDVPNHWEASLQNDSLIIAQSKETSENVPDIVAEPNSPSQSENITQNENPFYEPENAFKYDDNAETQIADDDFIFQSSQQPLESNPITKENSFIEDNSNSQNLVDINPFSSNTNTTNTTGNNFDGYDPFSFENKSNEPVPQEVAQSAHNLSSEFPDILESAEKMDDRVENIEEATLPNFNITNDSFENVSPAKVEPEAVPLSELLINNEAQLAQEPLPLESVQNDILSVAEADTTTKSEAVPSQPIEIEKVETKLEKQPTKVPSVSKPKVSALPATRKPLASATTCAATKAKTAAPSKVTSTVPSRVATKTLPKPSTTGTSNLRANALTLRVSPKPTATKASSSTLSRPTTISTTAPKPKTTTGLSTASTRANGTIGSRLTSASRPATSTISAPKSTLAARPTTSSGITPRVPISRPGVLKASTTTASTATRSVASSSNLKPKPTESKALPIRKSLPSTIRPPSTTGAPKPALTSVRTIPTKSTGVSAPTRTRVAPSATTGSQSSKVSSTLRPTTTAAKPITKPIARTGVASPKPATSKPVNGTAPSSGIKVVKKPATSTTKTIESKKVEPAVQSNSAIKSPFSAKRTIGVENSLKQELEAAAMNGLNGGLHPVANSEESNNNGVNGHSDL